MLASSSPPSPSPFAKVGHRRSMHSSASSPRQAAPASQKTTNTAVDSDFTVFHVGPPSRPQGATYQNASTQYSPEENLSQKNPPQVLAKLESPPTQDFAEEPSVPHTAATAHELTTSTTTTSDSLSFTSSQASPTSRRRQFRETIETDSASPTSLSYPPKRTRPSKTTAKLLPLRYELCEVEDMVALIADMISELIETNDNLPLRDVVLTRFHSRFVHHSLSSLRKQPAHFWPERRQEFQSSIISSDWPSMPP